MYAWLFISVNARMNVYLLDCVRMCACVSMWLWVCEMISVCIVNIIMYSVTYSESYIMGISRESLQILWAITHAVCLAT